MFVSSSGMIMDAHLTVHMNRERPLSQPRVRFLAKRHRGPPASPLGMGSNLAGCIFLSGV